MASVVNAKDIVVKIDGKVVGCAQSAELSVEVEMDEATCQASGGWKEVSPGIKSWTASFGSFLRAFSTAELASNVTFDDVFDALEEGTAVEIEYTNAASSFRYGGTAYVSGISWSSPEKGNVTWTANYAGSGALAKITA